MTFIDQVGDAYSVQAIDAEAEWVFDDKYYAMGTITLDLGEDVVAGGCC